MLGLGAIAEFPIAASVGDEFGPGVVAEEISPAVVLGSLLIARGHFTDPADGAAWPLYFNFLPEATGVPDNAAAIYDTAGIVLGRHMGDGNVIRAHGVQLRVRSRDRVNGTYSAGWSKARSVNVEAQGFHNDGVDVDGVIHVVQTASQQAPILRLGQDPRDSKRRDQFTVNYLVTLKEL